MHLFNRLMCGSRPDELVRRNRTLPVHSDGSQGLLAGGSEGDRGAGGDQGDPKGEPRHPPLEPLHLRVRLARNVVPLVFRRRIPDM